MRKREKEKHTDQTRAIHRATLTRAFAAGSYEATLPSTRNQHNQARQETHSACSSRRTPCSQSTSGKLGVACRFENIQLSIVSSATFPPRHNMKSTPRVLAGYGAFLILIGLVGYLSNPEKAKTALMSGGTFGLLNIGLGVLAGRGWRPAVPIALTVAGLLAIVFSWRSTVTWLAYSDGNSDKLVAALLISSMLVATVLVVGYLVRTLRRRRQD